MKRTSRSPANGSDVLDRLNSSRPACRRPAEAGRKKLSAPGREKSLKGLSDGRAATRTRTRIATRRAAPRRVGSNTPSIATPAGRSTPSIATPAGRSKPSIATPAGHRGGQVGSEPQACEAPHSARPSPSLRRRFLPPPSGGGSPGPGRSTAESQRAMVKAPAQSPRAMVKAPAQPPRAMVKAPAQPPRAVVKAPAQSPRAMVKAPAQSPRPSVKASDREPLASPGSPGFSPASWSSPG